MKILILNQRYTPYKQNKIFGGAEKVLEYQFHLLSEKHDVYFLTSSDSDNYIDEKVKTLRYPVDARDFSENLSGIKYNKIRNASILRLILEVNPDVILNHDMNNNSTVKLFTDGLQKYPTATYIHGGMYGGMSTFGQVETLAHFVEAGGSVVNVSESSRKEWMKFVTTNKGKLNFSDELKNHPEDLFRLVHHTPVCSQDDFQFYDEQEPYALMVARPDEIKNIPMGIKLCAASDITFQWAHPKPKRDSEILYFNHVSTPIEPHNRFEDLPRGKILEKIAKASFVLVCGPESFGLVAIEANLSGVPVVLVSSNKDHATIEALAPGEILHLGSKSFFENVAKFKAYQRPTLERRKEFVKSMQDYYSEASSYDRLMGIINRTIQYHASKPNETKNTLF